MNNWRDSGVDRIFWFFVISVFVLRILSPSTAFAAYIAVSVYALFGGRRIPEALIVAWFLTLANNSIFPAVPGESLARFLPICAAAAVTLPKILDIKFNEWQIVTIAFSIFVLIHSIFFSSFSAVSALKSATWAVTILSVVISIDRADSRELRRLESNIFAFLAFLSVASLAAFQFLPSGSMARVGFMRGILNHSQALGAMTAILGTWAFARFVSRPAISFSDGISLIIALACLYWSQARIGMFSFLLVSVIVLCFALAYSNKSRDRVIFILSRPIVLLTSFVFIAILVRDGGEVLKFTEQFVSKGSGAETLAEAYYASRGGLASVMWANILSNPWFGLGFGVASHPSLMAVDSFYGIPVGAAVEKGVTPLAIGEELGIPGFLFFSLWIVVGIISASGKGVLYLAILLSVFLLNLGEATLFSLGGAGLLQIVLVGWIIGISVPERRSIPRRNPIPRTKASKRYRQNK